MKSTGKKMIPGSGFALLLPLAALMASCNIDDAVHPTPNELGIPRLQDDHSYILPKEAGTTDIEIWSNLDVFLSVGKDQDWASLANGSVKGDGVISVEHDANPGFPRMTMLYLSSAQRSDTIFLKQEGEIIPTFQLLESSIKVPGEENSTVSAQLNANIDFEDLEFSIRYTSSDEDEGWVSNITMGDGKLSIDTKANPEENRLRKAIVTARYVDGWGRELKADLYLTQSNAGGEFGVQKSFEDIRWMATRGTTLIMDDIWIEGIVVNPRGNGNVAMNPNSATNNIDVNGNKCAAYIQSLDGRYGFSIVTATPADNRFEQYSKVQIMLRDVFIVELDNPERYIIDKVAWTMVMSESAGTAADAVPKERTIGTLTPDDMFTLVELQDVEVPVREGSWCPLKEGYASVFTTPRIDMYPLLIRDKEGGSMYMNINVDTPWRRTGEEVPRGSGTITGVVVNDYKFERFDPVEKLGEYQIRPFNREDIVIERDFEDGFSEMLVEWKDPDIVNSREVMPNVGTGRIVHTADANFTTYLDYTGLGPIVKGGANTQGEMANGSWQCAAWWDANNQKPHAWIVEFSTAGINTTRLSMQLTAVNMGMGAPRYWVAEWSEHGDNNGVWTPVDEYTIPDTGVWANCLYTQLPAQKNVDIALPLEMLGKSKVYIRLTAARNSAGNGTNYDGLPISNATHTMGYLAIRYNK